MVGFAELSNPVFPAEAPVGSPISGEITIVNQGPDTAVLKLLLANVEIWRSAAGVLAGNGSIVPVQATQVAGGITLDFTGQSETVPGADVWMSDTTLQVVIVEPGVTPPGGSFLDLIPGGWVTLAVVSAAVVAVVVGGVVYTQQVRKRKKSR